MTKRDAMWAKLESSLCSQCSGSDGIEHAIEAALAEAYHAGAAENAQAIRAQLTKIAQTPDIPHMSAVSTERLHALAGSSQYPDHVKERLMGEM